MTNAHPERERERERECVCVHSNELLNMVTRREHLLRCSATFVHLGELVSEDAELVDGAVLLQVRS